MRRQRTCSTPAEAVVETRLAVLLPKTGNEIPPLDV
jgi:hypothetical protein